MSPDKIACRAGEIGSSSWLFVFCFHWIVLFLPKPIADPSIPQTKSTHGRVFSLRVPIGFVLKGSKAWNVPKLGGTSAHVFFADVASLKGRLLFSAWRQPSGSFTPPPTQRKNTSLIGLVVPLPPKKKKNKKRKKRKQVKPRGFPWRTTNPQPFGSHFQSDPRKENQATGLVI